MNAHRTARKGFAEEQRIILDYVEWEQQISHSNDGAILAIRRGPALAIVAYLVMVLGGLLQRL